MPLFSQVRSWISQIIQFLSSPQLTMNSPVLSKSSSTQLSENVTPDSRLVSLHRVGAHPVVDRVFVSPALDGVVVARWEQKILVRVPLHELHVLRVPTRHCYAIIFVVFRRQLSDPNGLVSAASREVLTVMTPSHALHFVFMPFQLLDALKCVFASPLPDACRAVKASTR